MNETVLGRVWSAAQRPFRFVLLADCSSHRCLPFLFFFFPHSSFLFRTLFFPRSPDGLPLSHSFPILMCLPVLSITVFCLFSLHHPTLLLPISHRLFFLSPSLHFPHRNTRTPLLKPNPKMQRKQVFDVAGVSLSLPSRLHCRRQPFLHPSILFSVLSVILSSVHLFNFFLFIIIIIIHHRQTFGALSPPPPLVRQSNIELLGSDVEKKCKEAAAAGEPAWKGAGTKVRLILLRSSSSSSSSDSNSILFSSSW